MAFRWPFSLSSGAKFDVVFFGHSALYFGIGAKPSFYYKIDTPIKFWNLQEDIKLKQLLLTFLIPRGRFLFMGQTNVLFPFKLKKLRKKFKLKNFNFNRINSFFSTKKSKVKGKGKFNGFSQ